MMYQDLPSELKWLADEILKIGIQFDVALAKNIVVRRGFRKAAILNARNRLLLQFESQLYVLSVANDVARRNGFARWLLDELNYTAAFERLAGWYDSVDPDSAMVEACIQRIDQYVDLLSSGPTDRLSNYMRQLYYHAEQSDRVFCWELGHDSIVLSDVAVELTLADALAKADNSVVTQFFRRRGGNVLSLLAIAETTIAAWRSERQY